MTGPAFTALLVIASTIVQPDDRGPKAMLRAAIETEEAIAHGEIVFRYEAGPGYAEDASLPEGIGVFPETATIVFTFRDLNKFRIVVQTDDGVSRTIVSDGEYIDMGNGEFWDYRFFAQPFRSGIDIDNLTFFYRMWPYYFAIRPHLFPLRFGAVNMAYLNVRGPTFFIEPESVDGGDVRAIGVTFPGAHATGMRERYSVLPESGFRLARYECYFGDDLAQREEWGGPRAIGDGRFVMTTYQDVGEELVPDDFHGSAIDFGASNFDHMPLESEFVIDLEYAGRMVDWRPPHPIATEIEYRADDVFGIEIDVEPIMDSAAFVLFGAMASGLFLVILLAYRRARKS